MATLEHSKVVSALNLWSKILTRSFEETEYDLSPRQTLLMLHVYLSDPPHTIKSLTDTLAISKAATCRAVDVLCEHNLLKRKRDSQDKRNVFIQRTIPGLIYLSEMAGIIHEEIKTPLATI